MEAMKPGVDGELVTDVLQRKWRGPATILARSTCLNCTLRRQRAKGKYRAAARRRRPAPQARDRLAIPASRQDQAVSDSLTFSQAGLDFQ
jgi:hypothetical protein